MFDCDGIWEWNTSSNQAFCAKSGSVYLRMFIYEYTIEVYKYNYIHELSPPTTSFPSVIFVVHLFLLVAILSRTRIPITV